MKIVPVNRVTAVEASSSNANYPASRLLDERPKRLWIGTGSVETLTFTLSGGPSSAFGLFNTNATGVTFELRDPNAFSWKDGAGWKDGEGWKYNEVNLVETLSLDGESGACAILWEEINATLELKVSLVNINGETLQAGVGFGGKYYQINGPAANSPSEDEDDLSIEVVMSNGSEYTKDRDAPRKWSVAGLCTMDQFDDLRFRCSQVVKKRPCLMFLTDVNDPRWLGFCKFTSKPKMTPASPTRVRYSFNTKEVL